jgi:hypothetical protein
MKTPSVAALFAIQFLTFLCFISCEPTATTDAFEAEVRAEIRRKCPDPGPCAITLGQITPFKWDTLYLFSYSADKEEMEKVLGQPVGEYEEFHKRFIFLLNGKIIHKEATAVNVEHPLRGEILFENGGRSDDIRVTGVSDFDRVTPDRAYDVIRDESSGVNCFVLRPSK